MHAILVQALSDSHLKNDEARLSMSSQKAALDETQACCQAEDERTCYGNTSTSQASGTGHPLTPSPSKASSASKPAALPVRSGSKTTTPHKSPSSVYTDPVVTVVDTFLR